MSNPYGAIAGIGAEAGNIYQDIGAINKTQAGINQDTSTANQAYGNQNKGLQAVSGPGGIISQLTGPGGITSQLANWNGLKPAELAQLQTSLGNSTQSLLSTLHSQMGGVANPAQALQRLGSTQAQSNLQLTSNLGAQAQSQELGALESAGSLTTEAGSLGLGAANQYGQQGSQFMDFASQLSKLLSGEQQNLASATTGLATDIGNVGNPFAKNGGSTPALPTYGTSASDTSGSNNIYSGQ